MWLAVAVVAAFAVVGPRSVDLGRPSRADAAGPSPAPPVMVSPQSAASNHDADGQNVFFGDGPEIPFPNPLVGTSHDGIVTGRYTPAPTATTLPATSSPYDNTDSILLPTAH